MKSIYKFPLITTIICAVGSIILMTEYDVKLFWCYVFAVVVGGFAVGFGSIADDANDYKNKN